MLLRPVLSALCLVFGVALAKHRPTVYLIRHGEKPADKNDHRLNLDGEMRAQCLRHVFGQGSEYDIEYIMAPHMRKGESEGPLEKPCRLLVTIKFSG
jgi:hypothetical protein